MKSAKMLTIVVLALGLMVCFAQFGLAAPMGTAFTYQGRLIDANEAADGLYDFEFKLFDDPCTGTQQGNTIDINDLDVIDGYFTAELDFGSDVFNGDARWLETTVSHADGSDPCTLRPRIEVTPVPYTLHTRGIFVDDAGNVGIGTTSPDQKLEVNGGVWATGFYTPDNVNNYEKYRMNGTINGYGIGLTSTDDVGFVNTWANAFTWRNSPGYGWVWRTYTGTGLMSLDTTGRLYLKSTAHFDGNVGIGTTNPTSQLSVIKQGTDARATVDIQGQGTGGGATLTLGSSDLVYYKFRLKFDAATGDSVFENKLGIGDYRFRTWNGASFDERFTILNNGNVGIGATGPTQKLDVAGNVTASRYYDRNNTGYYVDPAGTSYCNDMRANIFYDRGNITYYMDPANTGTSAKFAGTIQANGNVESFGDNGNLNARFSYLTGYPNNGYIAVKDAAGATQAGMYVDSLGNGRIYADSKSFRVANPGQPGTEIWYTCPEGPEAAAYVRGTGHLTNGKAEVPLPDHFVAVASSQGITVQVTPLSAESRGLAVVHKAPDRFVVQELAGGNGTYDFDYLVMAVRKGHEGYQVIRPALEAQAADAGEAAS